MVKVYTKGGDKGQTSLYGGTRVYKSSQRVKTYGAIDTANASLGVARANIDDNLLNNLLKMCQLKLFEIGAEIASDKSGIEKLENKIDESDVILLEDIIDNLNLKLPKKQFFTIPGSSKRSAYLHLSRVHVRAAERELVELDLDEDINSDLIKFINRLSDLMFIISRYVDEVLEKKKAINICDENLNIDIANKIILSAREKACEIGVPMAISVVDRSGNLIAFNKMEDTLVASIAISQDKAYTAATLRCTTEALSQTAKSGGELYGMATRNRMVIFGGGIPVYSKGKLIGAIGVSGGSVSEDILVAEAGLEYFENREV